MCMLHPKDVRLLKFLTLMFEVNCATLKTNSDWMSNSTQFMLFSLEVDPIATPAADFSLGIFDHFSFMFCEPGTGTKLLHSMIYDIPSQQRMKNKLDFPTPFPDHPNPPLPPALPPVITPASFFLPMHVAAQLQDTNTQSVFTPSMCEEVFFFKLEALICTLNGSRKSQTWTISKTCKIGVLLWHLVDRVHYFTRSN